MSAVFSVSGAAVSNESLDSIHVKSTTLLSANPQQARSMARQGYKLAQSNGDSVRMGSFLRNIAITYQLVGNMDSAKALIRKSIKLLNHSHGLSQVRSLIQIGIIHNHTNDLDSALYYFKKAITVLSDLDDLYLMAFLNKEIARIYFTLGSANVAEKYAMDAFDFFKNKNGSSNDLFDIYTLIGNCKVQYDSLNAAVWLYKALYNSKKDADSIKYAIAMNNVGTYHVRLNQFDSAIVYFRIANRILKTQDRSDYLGPININYGISQAALNNLEKGEKHILEGIGYATEAKQFDFLMKGYNQLKEIYKKLHREDDFIIARSNFFKYKAKKEAILLKQSVDKVKYDFDLKLKENEAHLLKTEMALQQSNIEQQKQILLIILIAFVVIAFLLFRVIMIRNKLKGSTQELAQSLNELQKLNSKKDKLLSIISHDLRAPIGHLIYLQTELQNDKLDNEAQLRLSNSILDSTKSGLNMLDNILQWTNGFIAEKTQSTAFDTISSIMGVMGQLQFTVERKQINIVTELEELELQCDEQIFQIIIRNLLSNALKFTHSGGTVRIKSYCRSNNTYHFSITDQGSGFPPEVLESLYSTDKIKLNSKKGTSGEKGAGIGLSLSKEFAHRINGKIVVLSSNEEGSEVALVVELVWLD